MESKNIAFLQFKIPALESGDYELEAIQSIQGSDFRSKAKFSIQGPRFALPPEDVQAVYPPRNSSGDYTNILPHIALSRGTLAWERQAKAKQKDGEFPWLALLVLCGKEIPKVKEKKVRNLQPAPTLESGQSEDDEVLIIDVERKLLEERLPLVEELPRLAHVREISTEEGQKSISVFMANRLPLADQQTSIYLISLEHCINAANVYQWPFQNEEGLIRLVVLDHWTFSCFNEQFDFSTLFQALNRDSFCLAKSTTNQTARQLLKAGFVPLKHQLREGHRAVSWYRGPLLPCLPLQKEKLVAAPIYPDQLMRLHTDIGMLDASYAAAWQIGQLIALADQSFAAKLYRWKQTYVRQNRSSPDHAYLPKFSQEDSRTEMPPELVDWFNKLRLLKMLPFHYLVPEQSLLPPDSIRFFCVDPYWVDCLVDGAYSIGNIFTKEAEKNKKTETVKPVQKTRSGLMLRSKTLSNWPGLLVEALSQDAKKLSLVRMERLSDEVLICLFEGETNAVISQVNFFQKPEMLHYGFEQELDTDHSIYEKVFRTSSGDLSTQKVHIKDDYFRNKDQRVLHISKLSQAIAERNDLSFDASRFTAEEFALSMIEGVKKVSFTITGKN